MQINESFLSLKIQVGLFLNFRKIEATVSCKMFLIQKLCHKNTFLDDCAKDGGKEFFTKMHCVLLKIRHWSTMHLGKNFSLPSLSAIVCCMSQPSNTLHQNSSFINVFWFTGALTLSTSCAPSTKNIFFSIVMKCPSPVYSYLKVGHFYGTHYCQV